MDKSYDIKCGIIGILPDGKKMLFPTEEEYNEFMQEQEDEED